MNIEPVSKMKIYIVERQSALVVLVHLIVLLGVCTACSVPEGWQQLPVISRASDESVHFAILGNVTGTTSPRFVRRFGGSVYGAEVSVLCVYKKASQQNIYEEVTVIGFGESNDCTNTEVEVNQQYIFLMDPYQTGYAVVEYNIQIAAEPATVDNIYDMFNAFGCEGPSEPTTPPPTTTPLTTTRQPTTTPATTISTTTRVTIQEADGTPTNGSSGTAASLVCFAAVFFLVSPLALACTS